MSALLQSTPTPPTQMSLLVNQFRTILKYLLMVRKNYLSFKILCHSHASTFSELPPPNVTIHSANGSFKFTAGTTQTLVCSPTAVDHLLAEPVVEWISIASTNSTELNGSVLTIETLKTSHTGAYTCEARLSIPQAGISNLSNTITENITVQSKSYLLHLSHSQFL